METITKLKFVIVLILAVGITYLALQEILPGATNIGVANESIVFAANNTFVNLANSPIYTAAPYAPTLTYANGTTAVSNYTYNNRQVRIGFDIAAGTYFGHYTYYKESWFAGSDYTWMLTILAFIMGFAVLAKFIRLI